MGIKRYNKSLLNRLPSLDMRGLPKDIALHFGISPSPERHIFVMGAPRSGTTLLRGMIAAHSGVSSLNDETFFFNRRRVSKFLNQDVPNFLELYKAAHTKVELFDSIANQTKGASNTDRFLEKTPDHILVLPQLLEWFPHSHFVVIVRDGRDAFSSAFRNPVFFGRVGNQYPKFWRDAVRIYLSSSNARNLRLVKYEDLVTEPRRALGELMSFIEMTTEETQFQPDNISKTAMAKQIGHEMLSAEVNASSVGAYKTRLSPKQIEYFESIAAVELRAIGYPVEN